MSDCASRVTSGRTGRSSMETRRSVGSARDGRLADEQESEMSLWTEHELTDKVVEVLPCTATTRCTTSVDRSSPPQLAIEMQWRYPDTVAAIGKPMAARVS